MRMLCSFPRHLCGVNKRIVRNIPGYFVKHAGFCTASRIGTFSSYEEERSSYNLVVPKYFNFASDVLDYWANQEKNGVRSTALPAFWYVSEDGRELKYTFQELQLHSKRIANMLESKCGLKRGDNAIIMLPKIPEYWLINIAALRIGAVLSSATMMLTVKDVAYRLSILKPSHVIAHESVANVIDEASSICPILKEKILVSPTYKSREGWHDFKYSPTDSDEHQCAKTESRETMMIFFTSGTTGNPKMVVHTHSSYGIGLGAMGNYWLNLTKDNVMWNMSDNGWAKTAYSSFFGPWSQGACVFVHEMPRFNPTQALQVLCKYPIDTLCAAPLVYRSFVQEDLLAYKFKKLDHCVSAGESLSIEVIKKWREKTGLKIYEGYGQTENTGALTVRKSFEYRMGSIGKPMPGVNVAIVDENEREVEAGVTGEIVIEREGNIGLFKEYKDDPDETNSKLSKKYFHTGDLAYCDKDGYFWFVGRKDDLINSAGYRIGPTEVENALMEHTSVAEVAVISSPDEIRGEVVKALVVLCKNIEPSENLIKELQDHCKRVTAPYKYPRKIEFVKDFPKTVSGKIKRNELRQAEWKIK